MAITSPTDFHRRRQDGFRAGKLLEGEARDLRHHVIDGRFERGRRHPRDVVRQFVERVADGQLRRDLGDGKAGRLRRQRRRPRHPRVHLDDHHAPVRPGSPRTARSIRRSRRRSRATPRSRRCACAGIPCRSASATGATVMESPVCTPIGSTFSIEHTMMALSALSRMTSSSNSFQPSTDSSISTSLVGEASSPACTMSKNSSLVVARCRRRCRPA